MADLPEFDDPTLIVMLTGWIDASEAASAVMKTLTDECDTFPLVEFDDDRYIDYRARRPVMELRNGVNSKLVWSSIEIRYGHDLAGHDVVLLIGPEPDMYWHQFATTIGDLATAFGIRKMVGLGAYPYAIPHTRATRLSFTTPSAAIRDRLPTAQATLDLPAGMNAVLEHTMHDREIPAFSVWAQVPHYVTSMPYPAASVALIEGLRDHADIVIDGAAVRQEALAQRQRLDRLVEGNNEHENMVTQLERIYDAEGSAEGSPADRAAQIGVDPSDQLSSSELPSADELAGEIERFLRDQRKNP